MSDVSSGPSGGIGRLRSEAPSSLRTAARCAPEQKYGRSAQQMILEPLRGAATHASRCVQPFRYLGDVSREDPGSAQGDVTRPGGAFGGLKYGGAVLLVSVFGGAAMFGFECTTFLRAQVPLVLLCGSAEGERLGEARWDG